MGRTVHEDSEEESRNLLPLCQHEALQELQMKYWHRYFPAPMSFRAEESGGMGRTVHEESEEEPRNLPTLWYSALWLRASIEFR